MSRTRVERRAAKHEVCARHCHGGTRYQLEEICVSDTLSKIALNFLHCHRSVLVDRLALEAGELICHPRRPVEVGAANDSVLVDKPETEAKDSDFLFLLLLRLIVLTALPWARSYPPPRP
eukprot:5719819-Pyramimonas_sp.AAC.1